MAAESPYFHVSKQCAGCNRDVFVLNGQPALCGDCEVCPNCGSQTSFRVSKEHDIYECEWCGHNFPSMEDLERDVKDYWVARAKAILGIKD